MKAFLIVVGILLAIGNFLVAVAAFSVDKPLKAALFAFAATVAVACVYLIARIRRRRSSGFE